MTEKGTKEMDEDKLNSKTKDKTHSSDCLFEQFWTAYPKKASKAQALKAFRKLNPDQALLDAMLSAIDQQRRFWSRKKASYFAISGLWSSEWVLPASPQARAGLQPIQKGTKDTKKGKKIFIKKTIYHEGTKDHEVYLI